MPSESNQAIDLIVRIIADETADLRQRLQRLEHHSYADKQPGSDQDIGPNEEVSAGADISAEQEWQAGKLQKQLDAIKEIHKLDASPVQWTRNNAGQMVSAPEGLWEISCLGCNYTTQWREGEPNPKPCKTVRIANGEQ